MPQTQLLVSTLKKTLKAGGLTYSAVAKKLGLSEANVKRMFSTQHFTLQRIDAICGMLDMEITDLLRILEAEQNRLTELTYEQENELVSNIKLLLVAVCIRNRWSFQEIIQYYAISEPDCIRLLLRLDQLGLIELLPNNRIKLLVAPNFRWIPNGPIERFFEAKIQTEYLQQDFNNPNAVRLFISGELSKSSHEVLLGKLKNLSKLFEELHDADTALPVQEKKNSALLITLCHWELSSFAALRRKRTKPCARP